MLALVAGPVIPTIAQATPVNGPADPRIIWTTVTQFQSILKAAGTISWQLKNEKTGEYFLVVHRRAGDKLIMARYHIVNGTVSSEPERLIEYDSKHVITRMFDNTPLMSDLDQKVITLDQSGRHTVCEA